MGQRLHRDDNDRARLPMGQMSSDGATQELMQAHPQAAPATAYDDHLRVQELR
jgi:hypothetical protein